MKLKYNFGMGISFAFIFLSYNMIIFNDSVADILVALQLLITTLLVYSMTEDKKLVIKS